MYRTIADFTHDWDYDRGMTRKVLDNLTDASLAQAIRLAGRTLGRLAWHLGLTVEGPHLNGEAPATATA